MKRLATFPGMAASVGPFSQAVVAGGFVFTTGQIPLISGTDDRPADFDGTVRQVLSNLETVLSEQARISGARRQHHRHTSAVRTSSRSTTASSLRSSAPSCLHARRLRGDLGFHFRDPVHRSREGRSRQLMSAVGTIGAGCRTGRRLQLGQFSHYRAFPGRGLPRLGHPVDAPERPGCWPRGHRTRGRSGRLRHQPGAGAAGTRRCAGD